MKKSLLIGLIAIIACFSLVACGEKKEEVKNDTQTQVNNVQENVEENNEGTVEDSIKDLELYSDDTKMVFKFSDDLTSIFYYSGNTITGYESIVKYETHELAEIAKAEYEREKTDDDGIDSVTVDGNNIIVKYSESEYKDLTVEELKATYSFIQTMQGE